MSKRSARIGRRDLTAAISDARRLVEHACSPHEFYRRERQLARLVKREESVTQAREAARKRTRRA